MKATKVAGKMTGIVRSGNLVSLMAETATSRNLYTVECKSSDRYTVTKFDGLEAVASYETDSWESTCTCDGFRNGFFCRHLKMVRCLEARGVV